MIFGASENFTVCPKFGVSRFRGVVGGWYLSNHQNNLLIECYSILKELMKDKDLYLNHIQNGGQLSLTGLLTLTDCHFG